MGQKLTLEGMNKKNSYDKWWLSQDMENMAFLFEYCDQYCLRLYNTKIDKEKFIEAFMNANIRYEMERGQPRLLSESAYDSVKKFIQVDCNGDIKQFETTKEKEYEQYQLYWVGQIYAYIHYEMDIGSRELLKLLPLKEVIADYYCGHQMSESAYLRKVKWVFDKGEH